MYDFNGDGKVDEFDDFMEYTVSGGSSSYKQGKRKKKDHTYIGPIRWGWVIFMLFLFVASFGVSNLFTQTLEVILFILWILWLFVWSR